VLRSKKGLLMALDATVGGANSNTYATLAEADDYNSARTFSTVWSETDLDVQEASLIEAARLLDAVFRWTGSATDSIQARSWPRNGMFTRNNYPIPNNVIPQELKDAQAEYARQLVVGDLTVSLDQDSEGLAAVKAGPIEIKFKPNNPITTLALYSAQLRLQSPEFAYLSKLIPEGVRILLVPSWYLQASILQKAFVRAMR
jgi:hypothetical protein